MHDDRRHLAPEPEGCLLKYMSCRGERRDVEGRQGGCVQASSALRTHTEADVCLCGDDATESC